MATKGKAAGTADPGVILMLDPAAVLAENNIRFGLKQSRVDSLAADIVEAGEVMEPVTVEPLTAPANGHTHRLIFGFYRHEAVTQLNAKGAGMKLPAIARTIDSDSEKLRRQVAENNERENLSPMDQAITIQKLLAAGYDKPTIRKMFSRPGGKKGNEVKPASNAWLNMVLSFLELDKVVQNKIHDGRIGTAAAYELTKVAPEKRAEVLAKAEADILKRYETEEKEEEKFLKESKKVETEAAKARETQTELEKAQKEAEELVAKAKSATDNATQLYTVKANMPPSTDKKVKEKAEDDWRKADAQAKKLQGEADKKAKAAGTLTEKVKTAAQNIAEKRKALEDKRKTAKGDEKGKAVGPADVKKSAKATAGATSATVPLNSKEMRTVVHDLTLPGVPKTIAAFFVEVEKCFAGTITDGQLYINLQKITGEKVEKAAKK